MTASTFASNFATSYLNYCNIDSFTPSILSVEKDIVSNQNYGTQPHCHAIHPAMTHMMNYGIQPCYNTIQPTSTVTDINNRLNSELMQEFSNKSVPVYTSTGTASQGSGMEYNHCVGQNYGLQQPCYNSTMQLPSNMTQIENQQNPEIMHEYSRKSEPTDTPTSLVATKKSIKYQFFTDFNKKYYSQCDICQKTFANRDNLRRHRRTHGSMECYRCMVCGKFYLTKKKLAKHFMTHSTTESTPQQNNVMSEA